MRPVLIHLPFPWYSDAAGFHLAQLPIFSYGVMLGLSLVVGWYLVLWLCERDGLEREKMGRLYVLTAVCSVAAARLLYVFTNLERFDNPFQILAVWQGGLVAYGGFIGGFLTAVVWCRVHGVPLLAWADCVVPSLGSGLFFTRIGCLLFGCDFGKPVEAGSRAAAWALRFPRGSPAFSEQLAHGLLTADAGASLPVHPTQLYEALIGLFLLALVLLVRRFRRFSGEMFCAFTMAYGGLRFFVETLRADSQRGEVGPLSTSQAIAVVTAVLAGALHVHLQRRWKRDPQAARHWEKPVAAAAQAGVTPRSRPSRSARRKRR